MRPHPFILALLILGLASPLATAGSQTPFGATVDVTGPATPETPSEQRQVTVAREYQLALAARLAVYPDPRRKMTAAYFLKATERADAFRERSGQAKAASILHPDAPSPDANELVRAALRQGWDDPLLLWMAIADCPASAAACDAPAALARLREIEPENAANWLFPSSAQGADAVQGTLADAADADKRLAAIAESTRVNMHYADLLRLFVDAVSVAPVPDAVLAITEPPESDPEIVQLTYASGMSMAVAWPSIGKLTERCRGEAVAVGGEHLRQLCREAMTVLHQQADTVLIDIFASRTLLEVLPEGAEKEAIRQAQRNRRWQVAAGTELMLGAGDGSISDNVRVQMQDILKLVNDPEATEISHLRDRLVAAGVSLEAPADWTEQ